MKNSTLLIIAGLAVFGYIYFNRRQGMIQAGSIGTASRNGQQELVGNGTGVLSDISSWTAALNRAAVSANRQGNTGSNQVASYAAAGGSVVNTLQRILGSFGVGNWAGNGSSTGPTPINPAYQSPAISSDLVPTAPESFYYNPPSLGDVQPPDTFDTGNYVGFDPNNPDSWSY